jgi:sugar/nucleoside kinase (ribokinase family)
MSLDIIYSNTRPIIIGTGLVVLDVIINNGTKPPIFHTGGTCGNVLAGLSFLGWKGISVSRAGLDIAGNILLKDLLANGVNTNYITQEKNVSTPRIIEKVKSNGNYVKHHFLLRCPNCNAYLPRFRSPRIDFINKILISQPTTDVFFFDRVTPSSLKMAKYYRQTGALIYFEPGKLKNIDKLQEAINLSHVIKFAGTEKELNNNHSVDDAVDKISYFTSKTIIKTLGKLGLLFKTQQEKKWNYRESLKLNELFDSCGAGDWCTIGFLFYLQKLAKENQISLIETLESNKLIDDALHFAQTLAALSCKFIGARGISYSMNKEHLLEAVHFFMERQNSNISLNKSNKNSKVNILETINNDKNICKICLLC